jgi:hypothetical protein
LPCRSEPTVQMDCLSPPLLFSFFSASSLGTTTRRLGHEYLLILARTTHTQPMPPPLSPHTHPSLARTSLRKDHLCTRSALPPPRPHDRVRRCSNTPQPIFRRAVKWYTPGCVPRNTPPSPPLRIAMLLSGPLTSAKRGAPLWPVRASFLFFLISTRPPSNSSEDSQWHLTNPESFLIWTKKE